MKLAIDTSTEVCSVALEGRDGVLIEQRRIGKGIHSEQLFLSVQELMNDGGFGIGDLDELLLASGPGQYTGLRIGAAAVKGLLYDRSIPLVTIGTLEGFAAGVICRHGRTGVIHAVLDARREHLYHQRLTAGPDGLQAGPPAIRTLEEIRRELAAGDCLVGTGIDRLEISHETELRQYGWEEVSAINLLLARRDRRFSDLFRPVDPAAFEPDYLTGRQTSEQGE